MNDKFRIHDTADCACIVGRMYDASTKVLSTFLSLSLWKKFSFDISSSF